MGKRKRARIGGSSGGGSSGGSSTGAPAVTFSDEVFNVKRILDKRIRNGQVEYLLNWEGYPSHFDSWEPDKGLMCLDMIEEFERKLQKRQAELALTRPKAVNGGGSDGGDDGHGDNDECGGGETNGRRTQTGFDRGLQPEQIVGLTRDDRNQVWCLVKWANHTGAELIRSKVIKSKCPVLLCEFYQSHISWTKRRKH